MMVVLLAYFCSLGLNRPISGKIPKICRKVSDILFFWKSYDFTSAEQRPQTSISTQDLKEVVKIGITQAHSTMTRRLAAPRRNKCISFATKFYSYIVTKSHGSCQRIGSVSMRELGGTLAADMEKQTQSLKTSATGGCFGASFHELKINDYTK